MYLYFHYNVNQRNIVIVLFQVKKRTLHFDVLIDPIWVVRLPQLGKLTVLKNMINSDI